MSTTFKTLLYKELERLNYQIDMKIVHGRPYGKEARKHKALLTELKSAPRARSRVLRYNSVDKHKYARYALSA